MMDLFWNIFEKSGNLDAFLAYKEFSKIKKHNIDTTAKTDTSQKNDEKIL